MKKPTVQLTGEDGNVFFIIARVRKTLRKAGLDAEAGAFTHAAETAESYDDVIQLAMKYCEVE